MENIQTSIFFLKRLTIAVVGITLIYITLITILFIFFKKIINLQVIQNKKPKKKLEKKNWDNAKKKGSNGLKDKKDIILPLMLNNKNRLGKKYIY